VTSTLQTTPFYEMCSPKDRNFLSLNPSIGNITSDFLWIPSRIMPDNGKEEIIYEWRTCTGAIRRFRFEILQHLLIVKYFGCNRCGIGIQDYRNRLISKILLLSKLHSLYKSCLENHVANTNSNLQQSS
jgi:hypothetical protein